MQFLDLTLPSAAENVALDEALLDEAEDALAPTETLRVWEPREAMVVVGRSSQAEDEVRVDVCRELGIPILRRPSGGAAVVAGPGCLMYALVLSYQLRPRLRWLSAAHSFVLGKMVAALTPLVPEVRCCGTSDLAVGQRKFSGNSARCRRNHLLYHGTLLYNFRLDLMDRCLAMPPRMPEYREGRPHERFVTNLPLGAATIRELLSAAWQANERRTGWPAERTARLVAEKYSRPAWNGGR